MTQTELFPASDLGSAPITEPHTVPEAIAAGFASPGSGNPFLWSSTLWEAFGLGQHLHRHGYSAEGFRKSRGSSYLNAHGLRFRFFYDAGMWCIACV